MLLRQINDYDDDDDDITRIQYDTLPVTTSLYRHGRTEGQTDQTDGQTTYLRW